MNGVSLQEVTDYLNGLLRIAEVPDESGAVNGLQVENSGVVKGIVAAVDGSLQTIEKVARESAPGTLLLVHHGLFWGGNLPITAQRYRRLKPLFDRDIAVYSAHIPLDVHPEFGNNAVLARMLGILDPVPFTTYRGEPMGAAGHLLMSREALADRLMDLLGGKVHLIPGGPPTTKHVGVITGGAGSQIAAAAAAGIDSFVTGEGAHYTTFDALELGLNVYYAGHYATETVGVKALSEHLSERYGIEWTFHDHPTGL